MSSEAYWVLKVVLQGMAGLFAIVSAWLVFIANMQGEKHQKSADWFAARWTAIRNSTWYHLPEVVLGWVFDVRNIALGTFVRAIGQRSSRTRIVTSVLNILFVTFPLPVIFCFLSGRKAEILAGTLTFALAPVAVLIIMHLLGRRRQFAFELRFLGFLILILPVFWTIFLLDASLELATVATFILIPVYWVCGIGILNFSNSRPSLRFLRYSFFGGLTIALSFVMTFFAFLLGHSASPGAWVPQTLQMLISNVLFDGLTVLITFTVLSQIRSIAPASREQAAKTTGVL